MTNSGQRAGRRFSFSKKQRLVANEQFRAVLSKGVSAGDNLLKLYMADNEYGGPRLGVSVGKSCGNAVLRNRLKRQIREVFRLNQGQIPPNFDYFFMISSGLSKKLNEPGQRKAALKQLKLKQLENSFLSLIRICLRRINRKR